MHGKNLKEFTPNYSIFRKGGRSWDVDQLKWNFKFYSTCFSSA